MEINGIVIADQACLSELINKAVQAAFKDFLIGMNFSDVFISNSFLH